MYLFTQSRLFFELQLSVEEQNWGTAYKCAARCVTSQLPAAHRVYLLAVAFKAASMSAKQGVDDAETERWCRIGFCSSTTAEERHRFGALLVRASLDAGKWEEAMAAARVLMKRMTTAADPTSLIALLAATTAAKSLAGEKAEKELFSILQELSSNLEAVPEESIVHVAKRVVAVIDGLREGRVALLFLDAAVATAIHHKRTKSGKFLLFNLSYRSVLSVEIILRYTQDYTELLLVSEFLVVYPTLLLTPSLVTCNGLWRTTPRTNLSLLNRVSMRMSFDSVTIRLTT